MKFTNMKIGSRLVLGISVIVIILISVIVFQISRISRLGTIQDEGIKRFEDAIQVLTVDMGVNELNALMNVSILERNKEFVTQFPQQKEKVIKDIATVRKLVDTDEERKNATLFETAYTAQLTYLEQIAVPAIKAGKWDELVSISHEFGKRSESTMKLLQLIVDSLKAEVVSEDKKFDTIRANAVLSGIVISIISLILAIIYSWLLIRSITQPLSEAVSIINRLAEGDLTCDIKTIRSDETGQLLAAMKHMAESQRKIIAGIRDSSAQVAAAAGQISANSVQLARAAHSQVSAAEETATTMVQMAASIQTVAGNADSLACNAEEVSSSIQELGASSEQVAKSAEVMASSVTETSATIEQMTVSIERVAKNTEDLASSVTETSSTVEQMTVSIEQVAGNSQDLQQVATETAAIIEGLATSINQVAKNVAAADSVAKTASQEGYAGQKAVQEALTAMKRVAEGSEKTAASIINLGKRSEEIGGIVKVINEIADQTNLLALNAAIEAARAGDAGRGFAVVAEEVRKLAERSMVATKEIGQVIKQVQADTSDSVKYGEMAAKEAQASMDLSLVAGNALANIVRSIEQTSSLMSEVAAMTGQQADASTQVIKAVEKMNLTTAQVAGAAREQALGGRQIRIAIERMNGITNDVTRATREQALGGKQIRSVVENMNQLTQQVSIATREQSLSARQIAASVGAMNSMTQQVANATTEQKAGGEMVVKAVENISEQSRENLCSVEQLSKAAENLSGQAVELAGLVSQFRVN